MEVWKTEAWRADYSETEVGKPAKDLSKQRGKTVPAELHELVSFRDPNSVLLTIRMYDKCWWRCPLIHKLEIIQYNITPCIIFSILCLSHIDSKMVMESNVFRIIN